MKMLAPLSLITALVVAPAGAQEEKPEPAEPAAATIEAVAPTIEAVSSSTESAVAPESDAAAHAEDSTPQETVTESQE